MDAEIFGLENMTCTGYDTGTETTSARLFTFHLDPYYVDPESMLTDAASRIVASVVHGWTCDGGSAVLTAPLTPTTPPVDTTSTEPDAGPTCPPPPEPTIGTIQAVVCAPEGAPTAGVTTIFVGPQQTTSTGTDSITDANGEVSLSGAGEGDWVLWFYYADGTCTVPVHVTAGQPAPSFEIQYAFDGGDTVPCPVVAGSTN